MSLVNTSGTLFNKTSRNTPPRVPVIVPIITQTQKGNPMAKLLLIPTTVNSPRPIASNMNKVLPQRNNFSLNNMADKKAIPVVIKYIGFIIQNGLTSRSRSRVVPPPMAVTKAMIKAPNQSILFLEASLRPLIAKAKVPRRSRNIVILNSNLLCVSWCYPILTEVILRDPPRVLSLNKLTLSSESFKPKTYNKGK